MPCTPASTARRASSDVLDALEDDGAVPALAKPGELLPGQAGVGEHAGEDQPGGGGVLLGRLLQHRGEHRVGGVVGDALVGQEGEVPAVQVLRAPAQQRGVEGQHQGGVARRPRPGQEGLAELVVGRPVELEPAFAVAVRLGRLLDRVTGLGGVDVGQPQGRSGARRGQLALGVGQGLHADRPEQDRCGHRRTEDLGGQVAGGVVAQHPRHDAPLLEGRDVGAGRRAAPGAGHDVAQRLRGQHLGGVALQGGQVGGPRRGLPGEHPGGVDGDLVVAEVAHASASLRRRRGGRRRRSASRRA